MSIYYKAGFCVYTVNTFSTYIPITKSHYTYQVNRSLWSSRHIISEFCLTSVSLDCWRISWGLEELSVFRSWWRLSRQTRPARRTSSAGPRLTTPVNTTRTRSGQIQSRCGDDDDNDDDDEDDDDYESNGDSYDGFWNQKAFLIPKAKTSEEDADDNDDDDEDYDQGWDPLQGQVPVARDRPWSLFTTETRWGLI